MSEAGRPEPREIATKVIELLEPELAADGFDLLDVRVFQGGGRFQLRVYVDTLDGGINLDQCTRASRTVGMLLEEADLIADKYVIEVSSPGVRRPLRKLHHFQAAVGQKVDLKLHGAGGPRRVRGVLQELQDDRVVVLPVAADGEEPVADVEPVTVDLGRIREANLDPEFDAQALINADRRRQREEKRKERRERSATRRKKSRPRADKKEDESSSSGDEPGEDR